MVPTFHLPTESVPSHTDAREEGGRTIQDASRTEVHHSSQRTRKDDILPNIQRGQTRRDLDRSFRVIFHRFIILSHFERFVVEVLFTKFLEFSQRLERGGKLGKRKERREKLTLTAS